MYLEYDWTSMVYRIRFGDLFIAWREWRHFASLSEARAVLAETGNRLGRKTASRVWPIVWGAAS